jgi:hypothetical protein
MKVKVLAPIDVRSENEIGQTIYTTYQPGATIELPDEKVAVLVEREAVEVVKEGRSTKKVDPKEGEA